MDFSSSSASRLPAEFRILSETTVGIVGLGSLGSKVAVSLARSGVKRFLLIDDDVLAPQNLVRNQLSWRDVGYQKVDAVAREIKLVATDAVVETNSLRVAGQENPSLADSLATQLANCSLVLDATANPEAFVSLAAVCRRKKVSLVWGEVFAGGGGALMARSRPGLDANPLSVRNHIYGVLEGMPPPPEGTGGNYAAELDGRVYVASDADVSALAASITQYSLDTLCSGADSAYPVAAYLIGFRKFWIFEQPFDVTPIDCSGALRLDEPITTLDEQEQVALSSLAQALETRGSASNKHTE